MKRKGKQNRADILAGMERRRLEVAAARMEAAQIKATGAEARVVDEMDEETGHKRPVVRARRIDVFQLLRERDALPQVWFDAVRAYEEDLATANGLNSPERRPDHVRASTDGAPGQNVSQGMIDASRAVQWVRDSLSARDWHLLSALLHEQDGALTRWRATVERITGETNDKCHAAAIRSMAANLKDARDRYRPRLPVAA